ncbi:MAG: flagellar biosynthetic protein FliR [Bacillota bacterium]
METLYLLLACRTITFMALAPGIGGRLVPPLVRVGLGAWVSALIATTYAQGWSGQPNVVQLAMLVAGEVALGLVLAFAPALCLSAVTSAGWLVDHSMGVGVVNVIDPMYGTAAPLMGNYLSLLTLALWFGCNGHHVLLLALGESFRVVPPGGISQLRIAELLKVMVGLIASATAASFSLALPAIGVALLVDIWLGILSRSFPQVNAFIIGIPMKTLAVLVALLLWGPALGMLGSWANGQISRALRMVLAALM